MKQLMDYQGALKLILEKATKGEVVYKNLIEGVDECLAEDVFADRDLPPFHRAAMDGYALKNAEFPGKGKTMKISDTLLAGQDANELDIKPNHCIKIMTGASVPEPLDTVVRFEDGIQENNQVEFTIEKPEKWHNIALQGEDAKEGAVVIQNGEILSNTSMGIAAAVGHTPVQVYPKPTVAILTTGNEIIPIEQVAQPFQIRNSNSFALYSLLYYLKIEPIFHTIVSDDESHLTNALKKGLQADILIITGGFAKGEADIAAQTLKKLGVEEYIHGIQVKPGKPVWFGKYRDKHAVFGLPGNPVSAQTSFKAFVEQYIRQIMGLGPLMPLHLPLAQDHIKKHQRTEFVIAQIINENGKSQIKPMKYHGSGDYVNIQGSHGYFIQYAGDTQLSASSIVEFYPWKNFA